MSEEYRRPTEDEARAILVATWLAKFDEIYPNYGKGLETRPLLFGEFDEAMQDLPVEQLEGAFQEWRRIGTHFPSPGHIRGLITKKVEAESQYAAEQAWHEIRWRLTFFNWDPENGYLPLFVGAECRLTPRVEQATTREAYNGGWLLHPRPMDARTQHAIDAVGGLKRIAGLADGAKFDFTKRAFLEAYRGPMVERLQLGRNEAKQLMETIEKARDEQ